MGLIKSLWRGDVALWKTYWLFAVLGGFAFNLSFVYIEFNSIAFYAIPGADLLVWTLTGCAFVYGVFMLFAIWRSASKYTGPRTYAVLARIVVVFGALGTLGTIGQIFAPNVSEYSLREEVSAINAQLPTIIDDVTRLDRVSVNGLEVTYHYTLVDAPAAEYDSEVLRSEIMAGLITDTCEGFRQYLQAEVQYTYEYRGNDGNLVSAIKVGRQNCLDYWDLADGSRRELRTTEIAARARSAFVTITANPGESNEAFGSGFVITSDGVVATNLHIVEGANSIQVALPNGQVIDDVYVLGADEFRDILVLQLPTSGLDALPLGDDGLVEVGEEIFVLGNPFGFEQTFSNGLVSAIRSEGGIDYFQISAPISGGSSGGPVVNRRGEAIAIASMTIPNAQNLNIAIPVRYIYLVLADPSGGMPFRDFMSTADFSYVTDSSDDRRAESTALLNGASDEIAEVISDWQPWEQQVYLRLLANESNFAEIGWTPYDEALGLDFLAEGQQVELSIFLEAGDYVAAGVCDDDCKDLDLTAYDGNGTLLDSDEEIDAEPLVGINVSRAGDYFFEASMYTCETDTCLYAVQVYAAD